MSEKLKGQPFNLEAACDYLGWSAPEQYPNGEDSWLRSNSSGDFPRLALHLRQNNPLLMAIFHNEKDHMIPHSAAIELPNSMEFLDYVRIKPGEEIKEFKSVRFHGGNNEWIEVNTESVQRFSCDVPEKPFPSIVCRIPDSL